MKVLLLNTSETAGGAAIAARRLAKALRRQGVDARLLVRDAAGGPDASGFVAQQVPFGRWRGRLAFLWERLCIWVANGLSRNGLWRVDLANAGLPISRTGAFREADVVHLHWVNQGFLSLTELQRILRSGKKVVWTLHDMWPVTGVCHHAGTCTKYHEHCHDCALLCRPGQDDLSSTVFGQKAKVYATAPITFVACSQWLAGQAKASGLTKGHRVVCIPNTYDADLFHPADQAAARQQLQLPQDKRLLLFASHKVTNAQKGLDYLLRAFRYLTDQNIGLIVVGQMADQVRGQLPFTVYSMGYVTDEARMAAIYQAADLFVTPSLEENLPNTIMEAMACGTPCVGFCVGGIPEMIDHQHNGYVADYKNEQDLAAGIRWTLQHGATAGKLAAEKALATWNERVVAQQYINEYTLQDSATEARTN